MKELGDRVRDMVHQGLPGSHFLYGHVLSWLCYLLWQQSPHAPEFDTGVGAGPRERVYRALAYFREHMHTGLDVSTLATWAACSESHFRRLFNSVLGCPPKEALASEQISRARELLLQTNQTAEAIAEACGFQSVEAFSRAFRRSEGTSVRRWRSAHRGPRVGEGAGTRDRVTNEWPGM